MTSSSSESDLPEPISKQPAKPVTTRSGGILNTDLGPLVSLQRSKEITPVTKKDPPTKSGFTELESDSYSLRTGFQSLSFEFIPIKDRKMNWMISNPLLRACLKKRFQSHLRFPLPVCQ